MTTMRQDGKHFDSRTSKLDISLLPMASSQVRQAARVCCSSDPCSNLPSNTFVFRLSSPNDIVQPAEDGCEFLLFHLSVRWRSDCGVRIECFRSAVPPFVHADLEQCSFWRPLPSTLMCLTPQCYILSCRGVGHQHAQSATARRC